MLTFTASLMHACSHTPHRNCPAPAAQILGHFSVYNTETRAATASASASTTAARVVQRELWYQEQAAVAGRAVRPARAAPPGWPAPSPRLPRGEAKPRHRLEAQAHAALPAQPPLLHSCPHSTPQQREGVGSGRCGSYPHPSPKERFVTLTQCNPPWSLHARQPVPGLPRCPYQAKVPLPQTAVSRSPSQRRRSRVCLHPALPRRRPFISPAPVACLSTPLQPGPSCPFSPALPCSTRVRNLRLANLSLAHQHSFRRLPARRRATP
jgi:hypothetical protein